LPDLVVFLEVVRAGSLTRAAKTLHMVQSNVTARIKRLEGAVRTPLLHRHARGVRPTPAGEVALGLAQRTAAVLEDLRFTFGHGAHARAAKLRLGAIETVAACHLPALVAGFCRAHPQVELSVQTGTSATLLAQLRRNELDVVFVSRAAKLAGFRERVAFRDELVVVAPRAIPSLAELVASDAPLNVLVQRLGCSYTDRLLAHLGETSRRRCRLLELGTLEGIVGFVAGGLGIAAMPRAFASSFVGGRKVHLLELPRELRRLETYVVAPAGGEASFAVSQLLARVPGNRRAS
jgi:LysR family transcriptional regulator, cell division regulator